MSDPLEREYYLRFGEWHPSETSRNYATGETEPGVSTFGVKKLNGKWDVVIALYEDAVSDEREIGQYGDLSDTFRAFIIKTKRDQEDARDYGEDFDPDIFILRGDFVGLGYDGDPLIEGIEVVQRIAPSDIVSSDLDWMWAKREENPTSTPDQRRKLAQEAVLWMEEQWVEWTAKIDGGLFDAYRIVPENRVMWSDITAQFPGLASVRGREDYHEALMARQAELPWLDAVNRGHRKLKTGNVYGFKYPTWEAEAAAAERASRKRNPAPTNTDLVRKLKF